MIVFDIDGVIADFHTAFRNKILNLTGYDVDDAPSKFEIDVPGWTKDDIWKCILSTIKGGINAIQPYPNTVFHLWHLYDKTREPLQFLTARHDSCHAATRSWLQHYVIMPFELVMSNGSKNKQDLLAPMAATHFVDDRFRTVNEVCSDVKTYLFNRTWNEGRDADPRVIRINSIEKPIKDYLEERDA